MDNSTVGSGIPSGNRNSWSNYLVLFRYFSRAKGENYPESNVIYMDGGASAAGGLRVGVPGLNRRQCPWRARWGSRHCQGSGQTGVGTESAPRADQIKAKSRRAPEGGCDALLTGARFRTGSPPQKNEPAVRLSRTAGVTKPSDEAFWPAAGRVILVVLSKPYPCTGSHKSSTQCTSSNI